MPAVSVVIPMRNAAEVRGRRLRRSSVPVVLAAGAAYHALCFVGELATLAAPRAMQNRLHL